MRDRGKGEQEGIAAGAELGRRELLRGAALLLGALLVAPAARGRAQGGFELGADTRAALEQQPLVYVSPLRKDGKESRCHGVVWYFVDGGDVVIGTDPQRWKASSVKAGRDRARIWVPRQAGAKNYEGAFSFEARASVDTEPAVFERLLEKFGQKYAAEWGTWGPRFREGYANGSRVLLRYKPVAA